MFFTVNRDFETILYQALLIVICKISRSTINMMNASLRQLAQSHVLLRSDYLYGVLPHQTNDARMTKTHPRSVYFGHETLGIAL